MPKPPAPFSPPTAEQFAQHLDEHPPRMPSPWAVWGPLLAVAGVAVVGLMAGGAAAILLPWLAMAGLFVFLAVRVRVARELETRTTQTHEMAMLRHYPQALRRAWRLLPRATSNPLLHARVVAVMAHCLDHVQAYDAAITGYDYLLRHLPDEHPGAVHLRVQRTIAAFCADHLSDGDDGLRRLRGAIGEEHRGTPVAAGYRLARLIQQVRTNHFQDAIDASDNLLDDLRPLSVEAGYGHALQALCHHHHPGGDPSAARRAARLWWDRARMLLPTDTMIDRFPELAPLAASGDAQPRECA